MTDWKRGAAAAAGLELRRPVLEVRGLTKTYHGAAGPVFALHDVGFAIAPGKSLAIVGESGSGKTTAAMCVAGLMKPDAGTVLIDGRDLSQARGSLARDIRRAFGVVLQNPLTSLDPRMTIAQSVAEPLAVHEPRLDRARRAELAGAVLERVGLNASFGRRLPHELSGGQLQRASIARALILEPRLVVLDEPTSALDVSIQAQVLNLLCDLRDEKGLSYLFITHNLALVPILASQVLVMKAGVVVEQGDVQRVFEAPAHPYTVDLLAAVPDAAAVFAPTMSAA